MGGGVAAAWADIPAVELCCCLCMFSWAYFIMSGFVFIIFEACFII